MPQGKGTYGSKVGRPPKKDKYQDGGSIDPFSLKNPEGNIAEKMMEAKEGLNSIPTANAMERSQVSPMGNEVGTGVYKDGGPVSKLYGPKSKSVRRKKKRIGKIAAKIVSGSNRKDITDVVKQVNKQSKKYDKIDWKDEWDV